MIRLDQLLDPAHDRERLSGTRSRKNKTRSLIVRDRLLLSLIKTHKYLFLICLE